MLALIILWTMCALIGTTIPLDISLIGKQRKPVTHGVASIAVIIAIAEIAGLAYVCSQL